MIDYAPDMQTIIRDEEWMIKKIDKNMESLQNLYLGKEGHDENE